MTACHVITYDDGVGRWEPDARDRLQLAALELFAERGFAETTVPQITARAGLTTRTFFRHFADKREVLFAGEEEVFVLVARLLADAPAALEPMTLIGRGLETLAATVFEGRHEELRVRRTIVVADEGLRERELRKRAALAEAIAIGIQDRGVDDVTSSLAAQIGVTTFNVAINRWLDQDGEQPLSVLVHDTLTALRSLTAG